MHSPPTIFNRKLFASYRDRAANSFNQYDFLVQQVAENIAERLEDSSRQFPVVLDLGCRFGQLSSMLCGKSSIGTVIQTDISQQMLSKASGLRVQADEEYLPFADETFDLIISVLNLHTVNDLPGALIQLRKALKPDGIFIAALFGGETLTELRQSLMTAEIEAERGVVPHIAPFINTKDAGMLMQRAGFDMPVADSHNVIVSYENIFSLMKDIRGMGESNILTLKKNYGLNKEVLARAGSYYKRMFLLEEKYIKSTFEIVTVTGISKRKI